MMYKFLILLVTLFSLQLQAQSDTSTVEDLYEVEGIKVYKNSEIDNLYKATIKTSELTTMVDESEGYRIQIYYDSGNEAQKTLIEMKKKFLTQYPNVSAYTSHIAPNFRLRVGDFKTNQDAQEFYKKIKRSFPNSFIVRDKIKYTIEKAKEGEEDAKDKSKDKPKPKSSKK